MHNQENQKALQVEQTQETKNIQQEPIHQEPNVQKEQQSEQER